VLQLQATFAAGWAEATGTLLAGDLFFPPEGKDTHDGNVSAGCCTRRHPVGSTSAERYYALAIGSAKQRLWISNSYFVPSENFCELLVSAVKRGVDVRVLTCNEDGDVKSTYYAGPREVRDAARAGRAHLRVSAGDDARQVDRRRRAVRVRGNGELRQPLDVVQRRDDAAGGGRRPRRAMERLFESDLRYSKEITAAVARAAGAQAEGAGARGSLVARVL
jgi:cardiolipin synthase